MPADRHRRTTGKGQAGSPARQRARERIAAERLAQQHAQARRRMLAAGSAVTAVLAAVGVLVAVKLTSGPGHQTGSESAATAALVRQVSSVPASVLAGADPVRAVTPLLKVQSAGRPGGDHHLQR